MLMLARNVSAITDSLRQDTWDAARALGAGTHEIAGMTLGIVGVGAIGSRLASIARHGFGMRVLGTQRRLDRLPAEVEPFNLDDLVSQADFVVLACPLTPETGPVIDETALIEALRNKKLAGAMLDVYEHYRLEPGHALFALDNVVLTPHLSGMTVESRARMSVAAAQEMLRMLAGDAPRNFVNPQVRRVNA
jgi:D-3-phosphoglycerate dehydrogenase / 2-oxoglutarate reductase